MTDNKQELQDLTPEDDQEVVDLFAEEQTGSPEEEIAKYDLTGAVGYDENGNEFPLEELLKKEEPKSEKPVAEEKSDEQVYEVPEKYRDKELRDIIEMHRNAEKRMGQLQNELNEFKKLSSQLSKQELGPAPQAQAQSKAKIDVDSLLDNPEEALNGILANHPVLKQLQEQASQQAVAAKQARFIEKYPNATETVASPHFQEWVNSSPVRQRLYQQADQNYDLDLAGELMDTYHALHSTLKAEADAKRKEDLRTVQGVSSQAKAPQASGKRQMWYKQSQIISIMQSDPAKYQAMLRGDLGKALQEGRIHYHL